VATETNSTSHSLVVGLAFIAGAGLILMVTVAAVGAIQGDAADPNALGVLFALGVILLVGGIGAWLGVVRPFAHFDDINQPAPDEHHPETHHDSETALAHTPPADPVVTH
jgi:hypothetical protein